MTPLTKRETEIVELISQGYSSLNIAAELHISEDTVRQHRSNIFRKCDDPKNVVQLLRLFYDFVPRSGSART